MPTRTQSTWQEVKLPTFPALTKDISADVIVIGGGITGLLSAYLLAKGGKKVALLEKGRLASAATGFTTGFISQIIDTDYSDLVEMFGEADTKTIWNSHGEARELIEKIIKDEKIDCEFVRCPNYIYGESRGDARELNTEFNTMKKLGFPVTLTDKAILPFTTRRVMVIKNQAKYHPLKFLNGVVKALEEMSVAIYEKTEVTEIRGKGPFEVKAGEYTVRAPWTITATYHPFNNPKEVLLKKGMYKTYVVELEVPKGKYPEGTYEDMDNPYHYFRVDAGKGNRGRDRVILGGEDHRMELPMNKKNFDALLEYVQETFGKNYTEIRRWSGGIEEPLDGLAYIGEYDPHQLVATAFSGNGMTYGPISAMLFRDIILGKTNPWQHLYRPERLPNLTQIWKKARDYGEEFFRGAVANALKV